MNIINVKVNFTKGICETSGINLITGDYNSTKMVFEFDREDGTKVFEMKSPSEELVMVQEIQNNEIPLYALTDEDEIASLFSEDGYYVFEISLYNEGSKLTSVSSKIKVKPEQVVIDGEVVEAYLPVFDQLLSEVNTALTETGNLDISVSKSGKVATITLTDKDGETHDTEINDGKDFEYNWDGTKLGVRQEGESSYQYVDLKGATGDTGPAGTTDYNELENKPDLSIYAKVTEAGYKLNLEMNSSTYVITPKLYDKNNNLISTGQTIDLPMESVVVGGSYDSTNKKIVLTLKNGQTIDVPVGDLISGLQTEITNDNKLSSDLVDDTNKTHKFVTSEEKSAISANTSARHTHSNKAILDATTASYTTEEKTKLGGIEAGAEVNVIEGVIVSGVEQPIVDKKVIINPKIYAVKRKTTNNTSSAWIRDKDSVGLIANACKDGNNSVRNDFDNIEPWSTIKSYIFNNGQVVSEIGDVNYNPDGSLGDVYTRVPKFYYRRYLTTESGETWEHIEITTLPVEGFTESPAFSLGRYLSSYASSKLRTMSGAIPDVNRTIVQYRTLSQNVADGQLDYHYFLIQMLYLVEYADFNAQNVLGQGRSGFRVSDNDKALVAESSVNRIIINTTSAGYFVVGQQISIGTATWNWSIAQNRTITSIEDYSSGGITGKAIYFDGAAVNIALNNVIWTTAQKTGECDSLLMKSGCIASDSKHAIIYRGFEDIFGNIFQWVDGINIKDRVAYVCTTPSEYVSDKFTSPYEELGYTNASSDGWAKTLGYDANHPLFAFPTEVGAASNTGMTDYYYQNTGNRVARVGGSWYNGTCAGLWFWNLYIPSSISYMYGGSRLLKLA